MLNVAGLCKRYGDAEVVRGIDLKVRRGECFGLLGPNGAGKTTTLRLLLGLIEPDAGRIELAGIPVPARAREARMKIGVVPQMDNLDPDFSVRENLLAYGRYFGMTKAAIAARVPELLDFAGLAHKADARIVQLSGGMKRRLTLARALIESHIEPAVVEVYGEGLDAWARDRAGAVCQRSETVGETLFCYTDDAQRVIDALQQAPALRYLHRPSNLEDVFLKLTGRDLRD